ncbi:MAG TPA: CoA transferase, partial [Polyangiaceae bacterium]|nr:CoA transferase [Polyangiaceae bacterium]
MSGEGVRAAALSGVRVIELGQLVAGPYAATLLGYFGAEVIKVEAPSGDPIRGWRGIDGDGTSLWWRSLARNKKSVAIDLRDERGQDLVRQLILKSDVLIENFRPGTLERWNLDPAVLQRQRPDLIVARVSGYGQTGPRSAQPGYASVCEAFGGLRHLTGVPGEPPVRSNLSLGDTLAGLHTAIGILTALVHRQRWGRGQLVDTAIYEAVFSCLESVVPEYDRLGKARGPSGSTITGVVPTGTYECADGKRVVMGANGEAVFRRLCEAMGVPALADDPRFIGNEARVANQAELEARIAAWFAARPASEAVVALMDAKVPCSPIFDAADMFADPHYTARGQIERPVDGGPAVGAIAPKLSATPGRTRHLGPELGADTATVLSELGVDDERVADLRA